LGVLHGDPVRCGVTVVGLLAGDRRFFKRRERLVMGWIEQIAKLEAENDALKRRLDRVEGNRTIIKDVEIRSDLSGPKSAVINERELFGDQFKVLTKGEHAELMDTTIASLRASTAVTELAFNARDSANRAEGLAAQAMQAIRIFAPHVGYEAHLSGDGALQLDAIQSTPADVLRLSGELFQIGEGLEARIRQSAEKARISIEQNLKDQIRQFIEQERRQLSEQPLRAADQFAERAVRRHTEDQK
jgi:hypothetical protein